MTIWRRLQQFIQAMDEKHKELLEFHRSRFVRAIDPERLSSILKGSDVFNDDDLVVINGQPSKTAKVEKLLDILPSKGMLAFQHLCHALESTYPHLLTLMFLGGTHKNVNNNNNDSHVASHTDSQENGHRHAPSTDNISPSSTASKTYTKLIPAYKYELNSPNYLQPCSNNNDNSSNECHSVKSKHSDFHFPPKVNLSQQNKDYRLSINGDNRVLERQRNYEALKMQYEHAVTELQTMKRQHVDSIKDVDTYRASYVSSRTHVPQKCENIDSFKNQSLNVNPPVERLDFTEKPDILEMRKQQQQQQHTDLISERGSTEVIGKMSENSIRTKYELLKKNHEILHQRYSDLLTQHAVTCSDLDKISIEIGQTQKNYNEACSDRDNALSERNSLQQQCTTALRNWNASIHEISDLKDTLDLLTLQQEKQKKESQQTLTMHLQTKKDLESVSRERDAALREYALIMSERASVHKEIEQQQDKITEATKRLETIENEKKTLEGKVKKLQSQTAELLEDRNKAVKDYSDLYQKYADFVAKQEQANSHGEFCSNYPMLTREHRDFGQCQSLAERDLLLRDSYEHIKMEQVDEIDQGIREVDTLKKHVEKLQHELNDALQEAELAKKTRDRAFDERNKIVQERESIKNLCDSLRRDRDRAVSDLAQALRDSDELKKQKNEACREFKELKEKYDTLLEKDTRKSQLNSVGHNHSRDSAIDADMLEWETETLQIDISGLDTNNLGFELTGGTDDPQFPNDSSIFISHVSKGSAADGKLKVNDVVVRVNNIDVTNVERKVPLEAIFNTTGVINMVVRRRRSMTRLWQPIQLTVSTLKDTGIQVENGLFISRISAGSVIAKDGTLVVGDRINNINGQTVSCKTASEVMKMLQNCEETVVLDVWRQTTSPANSTGSSPTPTCQPMIQSLHEQSVISAAMSDRSCNEADKDHLWDSGMEESKDSKTVRHNGSQTDSLDSPRPHHRKNNKSSNQKESENRSRYSTSDKFLEKAWEFFKKGRHTKYSDRPERNSSQIEEDKVIAEFNAVISLHDDYPSEKKKELDHENSGTWPKYRGMQTNVSNPGTVISMSSQKRKDRPPLSAILNDTSVPVSSSSSPPPLLQSVLYNKSPPMLPERTNSSFAASTQHSPQNSGVICPRQTPTNQLLNTNTISSLNPHLAKSVPSTTAKEHFQINVPDTRTLLAHSVPVHPSPSTLDRTLGDGYSKGMRPKLAPNKYEKRFPPPQHGIHQIANPQLNPANSNNSNAGNNLEPHSFRMPQSAWSFAPSLSSSVSPTTDSAPVNKYRLSPVGATPSSRPQSSYSNSLPSQMTTVLRQPSQGQVYQVSSQRVPPQGQGLGSVTSPTPVNSHLQSLSPRHNSPSYMTSSIPEMEPDCTPYHLHSKDFQLHTLSPPLMHPKEMPTQRPNRMTLHRPGLGTNSIMKHHRTIQSVKNVEKWLSNISNSSGNVDRSTPTPSEDFPYNRLHSRYPLHSREIQELNGCSTFPKHGHERIRIPSNTSVATKSSAGRISTSSAEVVSERSSPMSPIIFPFERSSTPSLLPPPSLWVHPKPGNKPNIGDTRRINIEMTSEPVGFKIDSTTSGGIFVSSVSENSLACEHGLCVGDQLLEVCGINMRIATYQLAASVLRQCRENLSMLVQYNPMKYKTELNMHSSPPNSPKSSSKPNHRVSSETLVPTSPSSGNILHRMSTISSPDTMHLPSNQHCIILDKPKSTSSLGLSLTGGQGGIGVFVDDVRGNSLADGVDGLGRGYQILECNGMNLRYATVEQAMKELSKPTSSVKIISQYNPDKVTVDQSLLGGLHRKGYLKCRYSSGGPFFLRSLFDHHPTDGELSDLSFSKSDILFVKDVCRGGLVTERDENGNSYWFAWLLNHQGKKLKYGRIPTKLNPSFDLKRSSSESLNMQEDELKYSRRGSGTVRRSFFKRKKHQRTNSRDSRDLSSFSEISLTADSLSMSEDGLFYGFTKVEKKECKSIRPIVFLAPLAEPLIKKLTSESPDKYCQNDTVNSQILEKSQTDGAFLEYQKRDDFYESITRICDNNCHCLLNVNPSAIERLHRLQIYPIVIFVRHKNSKQIREIKDVQFLPEKVSNKNAKELFEQFQKTEQEYRHYISVIIPGGNLAEMCMQIKRAIDIEQKKTVFIPCNTSF